MCFGVSCTKYGIFEGSKEQIQALVVTLYEVAAVTAFLVIQGNSPGPMFQFKDRTPLTKQRFIFHIRNAIKSVGIDPTNYVGHSFRIRAATTAAERGIQDSTKTEGILVHGPAGFKLLWTTNLKN